MDDKLELMVGVGRAGEIAATARRILKASLDQLKPAHHQRHDPQPVRARYIQLALAGSLVAVAVLLIALLTPVTPAFAQQKICVGQACTTVKPSSGPGGTQVTIRGTGFPPGMVGQKSGVFWQFDPDNPAAIVTIDSQGSFIATFRVPPGARVGKTTIDVKGDFTVGGVFDFEVAAGPTPAPTSPPAPPSPPPRWEAPAPLLPVNPGAPNQRDGAGRDLFQQVDQDVSRLVTRRATWQARRYLTVGESQRIGLVIGEASELQTQIKQLLPRTSPSSAGEVPVGPNIRVRLICDPDDASIVPSEAVNLSTGSRTRLLWTWFVRAKHPTKSLDLTAHIEVPMSSGYVNGRDLSLSIPVRRTIRYTVGQIFTNWGTWVSILTVTGGVLTLLRRRRPRKRLEREVP